MSRFIKSTDYSMQIRQEIIKLLTSGDNEWFNSSELIRAENTAIAQIKNRIGKRYDCFSIFTASGDDQPDMRDQWIVTIVIDIALYHLYSKTGSKDLPQHRSQRYQDAIDWLKDVGNGETVADLPQIMDSNTGEAYGEFIFNSREPQNHKY